MTSFNWGTEGIQVVKTYPNRVKGKTFVITGPSVNSLGAEAAKSLAHGEPATIILGGRSEKTIMPVIEEIKKINPSVKTHFVQGDLSDNSSIRKAAAQILELAPKIDCLILSAGIMGIEEYTLSKDGYELQLAACHIGHFLLTALLWPALKAADQKPRVISLTSTGYEGSEMREDWNFSNGKTYDRWTSYGQAKTANILFTLELARRGSEVVDAYVLHPGVVLGSGILKSVDMAELQKQAEISKSKGKATLEDVKSLQQGCSTTLVACLADDLPNGSFLKDCQVQTQTLKPHARDEQKAKWLWELSEELVKEKFL